MSTLIWTCPDCGASRESEGTDRSSRESIEEFQREHDHKRVDA